MSVQLVINIEDHAVKEKLIGLTRNAQDLSPVFRSFGEYMIRSIGKNFREGGRPGKWEESQRVKESGGKTLIKTRRLQNSITYKTDKTSLTLGSNVIYARIHQLGGQAGRGRKTTIPARPYLMFQDDDFAYLRGLIRRRFGL